MDEKRGKNNKDRKGQANKGSKGGRSGQKESEDKVRQQDIDRSSFGNLGREEEDFTNDLE